ncbi:SET domain-containing protein 9 isoform X4 [Macrotis lagotis]|uniref:SET domain-containing protein 9 isoform X4 n=1 Tax=Macrotis lagotis TaxID=92651 RepID=UPI003D69A97D
MRKLRPKDTKVTCRTLRYVPENSKDKIISDEDVLGTLLKVFQALFISDFSRQTDILVLLPEAVKSKYQDLFVTHHQRTEQSRYNIQQQRIHNPGEVLFNTLGFNISRETSSLISAGKGVFVTKGFVPKGAVVSMYPGTVYQKHEPIFFQSIRNPFIFRCLDGILIDGNDKGLSKVVYRSCNGRDRFGPFKMSDSTWLTSEVQNPLAIGQYVNNCSNGTGMIDVHKDGPEEVLQGPEPSSPLRCVVLVALRDIQQGEELFSNYYTIIN